MVRQTEVDVEAPISIVLSVCCVVPDFLHVAQKSREILESIPDNANNIKRDEVTHSNDHMIIYLSNYEHHPMVQMEFMRCANE